MTTTLIRSVRIVNGDGHTEPLAGDVLLEDDRIRFLGEVPQSAHKTTTTIIDGKGLVLAPGFVDTHNHGALGGCRLGDAGIPIACELALRGGVTKRICGVDGFSPAPVLPTQRDAYAAQLRPLDGDIGEAWSWSTLSEFYLWHKGRSITDLGMYLGHSAVRLAVMGNAARKASADELRQMSALVRQEAPHSLGFSTGLVYNPAVFSDKNEIEALLRAYGQVRPAALFPHLRSESDMILPSLKECLEACSETGSAYCSEHTKIAGKKNYQKIGPLEDMLADGAASVPAMGNMYPYTAGSTTGDALFPPKLRAASRQQFLEDLKKPDVREATYQMMIGDTTSWDNFIAFSDGLDGIQIAGTGQPSEFLGQRLGQVARASGHDDLQSRAAFEAVFDFFVAQAMDVTIITHYGSELIMERLFKRPDMAICTDGLMPGPGQKPHPRSLGSFPKALRMARELGMPLQHIVGRLAELPCRFLGLPSPVLAPGSDASMVLFDWEQVRENNTYDQPLIPPTGIHKVWVHGKLMFNEGSFATDRPYPGRILAPTL